jgi:hypothetical protein
MRSTAPKAQCPSNPAGFHKDVLIDGYYKCICCGMDRGKPVPSSITKGMNVCLQPKKTFVGG